VVVVVVAAVAVAAAAAAAVEGGEEVLGQPGLVQLYFLVEFFFCAGRRHRQSRDM